MIQTNLTTMAFIVGVGGSMLLGASAALADECEPQWYSFSSGGQIGLTGTVRALAVYQGDLIVGGQLQTAGGQEINHIARWDGQQWHTLESGGQVGVGGESSAGGPAVDALAVWGDNLVVGGRFQSAGGQEMNRIAIWDGESWHPIVTVDINDQEFIGIGAINSIVYDIHVRDDGLVVGGFFETAGGETVNNITRRIGSQWLPYEVDGEIGMNLRVHSLQQWNGDLYAGGRFLTAGGQWVSHIAQWTGTSWQPLASGGQTGVAGLGPSVRVRSMVEYGGDLYVGGLFGTAGGQDVNCIARWDGEQWHSLTANGLPGVDGDVGMSSLEVFSMVEYQGDLIVAGRFITAGGDTMNYIARWDGNQWHPFIANDEIGMQTVVQVVQVVDGNLLAGGVFNLAGGKEVRRLARWDECSEVCDVVGDLNCDNVVNVSDLLILLGAWGTCSDPENCAADLNGDGVVNVSDLLILLGNWG